MKKAIFLLLLTAAISDYSMAQKQDYVIPAVDIKKMDGTTFNTANIKNDGKPMIIDFWATWCSPCKAELNAIAEDYEEWQKETGVVLYAISIDDARNVDKVAPYVNGKGWEYIVLSDVNGDFKRAMNVNNVPHVFVINGNREVVYQQNSAAPGDDKKLYEIVKKVAKGEKIN
ncbi:MAG: TlpA family protein disulfide reductase [Bacteroidota bacterium]|jgi:cytochrome c biogenesis protein CcmG/thiol:disulfide interchange protein DsbE